MGLGLDMLDVAIGVVFVFLLISLIASSIAELIEVWLKRRSKDLEKGVRELLSDRDKLVTALYEHPLILSLYKGSSFEAAKKNNDLPSYIPARNFALAAMDLLFAANDSKSGSAGAVATPVAPGSPIAQNVVQVTGALRSYVKDHPDAGQKLTLDDLGPKLATVVLSLIDAANGDAVKIRESLENWFNSGMDRVSGWYKRWSHQVLIVIGALLAILFNVDTIAITQALSVDKSLRQAVMQKAVDFSKSHPAANQTTTQTNTSTTGTTAPKTVEPAKTTTAESDTTATAHNNEPTAKDLKKSIQDYNSTFESLGLPVGWTADWNAWTGAKETWCDFWSKVVLGHLLGWLITAFAVSLGAPFWFDTLNKIIVVRSTVKPKEKSQDEPSKS